MQKLLQHPVVITILTVLAIIFYFSLEKSTHTAESSVATLKTLHQQTEKLNEEVVVLEKQLLDAESSMAQEKVIRNELLLQKPGEYIVQLGQFKETKSQAAHKEETATPWEKWKKVLL